jgi:hypothetical protein
VQHILLLLWACKRLLIRPKPQRGLCPNGK